jgi:hypothetical protein
MGFQVSEGIIWEEGDADILTSCQANQTSVPYKGSGNLALVRCVENKLCLVALREILACC